MLTVITNEKIKQEREAEKGKKKVNTKKTLRVDDEMNADVYDDFM